MSVVVATGADGVAAQNGYADSGTAGGPGGRGDDAVAVAASDSDADNSATAYAGRGAAGGQGANSASNGTGGAGGDGGAGGNAQASATTTIVGVDRSSATAIANTSYWPFYNFQTGMGGWSGYAGFGSVNGQGGSGGRGGDATAQAIDTGARNATATARSYGGHGGIGTNGQNQHGGDGGTASGTSAYASGIETANAGAFQTGGDGGQVQQFGQGGAGASSTLTNAVGGETNSGELSLTQQSTAGSGGESWGPGASGAAAGAASSTLDFDDRANATHSTKLYVDVVALGGDGGGGANGANGATGGSASAADHVIGVGSVVSVAQAIGGDGGETDGGVAGAGGGAYAHSHAVGVDASSFAQATGGRGRVAGAASAIADGDGSLGLGASNCGYRKLFWKHGVLVSAIANSNVSGHSTAEATISDNSLSSTVDGQQALVAIAVQPDASNVADIASRNPRIAQYFSRSPSYFVLSEISGHASSIVAAPQTVTEAFHVILDQTQIANQGRLILGFFGGAASGSGPANISLDVIVSGLSAFKVSFDNTASANTFFSNNAIALTSLVGTRSPEIVVSVTMTFDQADEGYTFDTLVGEAGTPPSLNHAPVVTASNITLPHSLTPVAASTLFSGSDPDGDALTYHIFNSGSGNAHFLLGGVDIAKGTAFDVTASQLSQLTYQGGSGGADTIYVRATDDRSPPPTRRSW